MSAINVNTATLEELKEVPGVGSQYAGAIVSAREKHGFLSQEILLSLDGFPKQWWTTKLNSGAFVVGESTRSRPLTVHEEGGAPDWVRHLSEELRKNNAVLLQGITDSFSKVFERFAASQQPTQGTQLIAVGGPETQLGGAVGGQPRKTVEQVKLEKMADDRNAKAPASTQPPNLLTAPPTPMAIQSPALHVPNQPVISAPPPPAPWHNAHQAARERGALSTCKLPSFDGKADSIVTWRAFLVQFNRAADRQAWGQDERLDRLIECFREEALVFFTSLDWEDQNHYLRLCSQMEMRFQKKEPQSTLRRRLQDLRQEVDEPLEAFAGRTRQLARDAYPHLPNQELQGLAVDAFLQGCRDKLPAYLVASRMPATLQQALEYMRAVPENPTFNGAPKLRQLRFEESEASVCAVHTGSNFPLVVEDKVKQLEAGLSSLQLEVKTIAEEVKKLTAKAEAGKNSFSTCFRCGESGHYSRECRSRSRSPSPTSRNCYNCQRPGHLSRDCTQPRRPRSPSPSQSAGN